MKDYTIAVLGCGNLGSAVTNAILNSSFEPYPAKIICCTNSEKSAENVRAKFDHEIIEVSHGIDSNKAAVAKANIIILGCKPYMYQTVYEQVKDSLNGEQLLISLLAGTTTDELSIFTPYVAKVMTNTPAQYGCGMAAVCFSKEAEAKYSELVMKLIQPIGSAVQIVEKNMDAATALVGSAPAFVLLMLESMIDGGVRMGLPFDVARESAIKVMEGTAKMVLDSGEHPAVLKSKICTPAGTTIGGLAKLEDAGVRSGIIRAIEESALISASFSKKK